MQKTIALAHENRIGLGAHPGYPDLVGFGRRTMAVSPKDVYAMVVYQVGALAAFAKAAGGRLQHVKPHGAMYNMAAKDAALAEAIAQAVYDVDKDLILLPSQERKVSRRQKRLAFLRLRKSLLTEATRKTAH